MGLEFLKEVSGNEFLITKKGFAEYCFPTPDDVYITNIYVRPEYRREGVAAALADEVARLATKEGCKTMLGSVMLTAKNVDRSIDVLRGYGMSLASASNQMLVFKREL